MSKQEELLKLLGEMPAKYTQTAVLNDVRFHDGYKLECWQLDLNGIETVPAYVAKPLDDDKKYPLVLFNHSHGGCFDKGKEELITSSSFLQKRSFAQTITQMGYMAACIDMWSFGERRGRPENDLVKMWLLEGRTVWGMRLFDNISFLDFLISRDDVDASRIASIGLSMGGLMSWWHAALDNRISVCVDIAAQVSYEALIADGSVDGHGFYYYIPGLLQKFSTFEIQKMIAPRFRLSVSGVNDKQCPVAGVLALKSDLQKIYQMMNCPGNFVSKIVTGGHQETAESRRIWTEFLKNHL